MKSIANLLAMFGSAILTALVILVIAVFVDDPAILLPISFAIGAIGVMATIPDNRRLTNEVRWAGWTASMVAVLFAGIINAATTTSDGLRYPEFAYSVGQNITVAPECGCRHEYLAVHPLDWPADQGVFPVTPKVTVNYDVDKDTVFILYTRVDRSVPPAIYIAETRERMRLIGAYPDKLMGGILKLGMKRDSTAWIFDWPDSLPIRTKVLIQREEPLIPFE